jgi:hypothetical protein
MIERGEQIEKAVEGGKNKPPAVPKNGPAVPLTKGDKSMQ